MGVKGLTFDVAQGDVVGLLGPNGSGKTTTVNLLTTTFPPTDGNAQVMGYDVVRDRRKVRQLVALAPQQDSVNWWLTVYQNIDSFAALLGWSRRDRKRVIEALLDDFELADKRDETLDNLSGGQLRRVQVIRALMFCPRVLFVDEPTLGLDPLGVDKVLEHLAALSTDGVTVVLATNEMDQVEAICRSVIFLNRGVLVDQGRTSDFVARYADNECIEIQHGGDLPDELRNDIQVCGFELKSTTPLVFAGPKASRALPRIIAGLISNGNHVRDVKVTKSGLRDAFIKLVKGGASESADGTDSSSD